MKDKLLLNLAKFGVISRYEAKNYLEEIKSMQRRHLVQKVYKKGRVFYQLTEESLPLLEQLRQQLLAEVKIKKLIYPRRAKFYDALLSDLRFFDHHKEEADDFLFLGDWRLTDEVKKSQLKLSQHRYFEKEINV